MADQANGWFYKDAVENIAKSRKAGRPIFDDVVMVQITIPGDKNNTVVNYANDAHKERFPKAWEAFEASEEEVGEGTPLEQWPMMTAGRVMELKTLHIHTVEALAGINESFMKTLGVNGRRLVEDAQAYLKTAEDGPSKVAAENAELSRRVETLEAMIKDSGDGSDLATENAELKAKIAELEAAAATPDTYPEDGKEEVGDEASDNVEAKVDKKAETAATKKALKAQIKELTGEEVIGNPSVKTLKKTLKKTLDEAKKD